MPHKSDIRIVKNTVITYIRMAITIIVGLVTSRLVLQAWGLRTWVCIVPWEAQWR